MAPSTDIPAADIRPDTHPSDGASTSPHAQSPSSSADVQALSILLQLEAQTRTAQTVQELQFMAVNETRRLLPYRQAFLFRAGSDPGRAYRLEAASSLPIVERHSPLVQWLERTLHTLRPRDISPTPVPLTEEDAPEALRADWKTFSFPYVLWCPLVHGNEPTAVGGLWLARETPWSAHETTIAQRLAANYAYVRDALSRRAPARWRLLRSTPTLWVMIITALAALAFPVRFSTLAPAKVVPVEPAVVSAPMDGVIADILVPPNTMVAKGQTLFRYEDTNLRSQYDVAEKALAVTLAEYTTASQGAFLDNDTQAQVGLLQAEVDLRAIERDYALTRLRQIDVTASQDGLLLYTDKSDWIGRPVDVGQRIMEIADPSRVELHIDLPVNDAIMLKPGADMTVFLDAQPLQSLSATLLHTSYHATRLPDDVLAYQLRGQFTHSARPPRIGWQGTAKIYGEDSTVFFLLFRRPLSAARQMIGW